MKNRFYTLFLILILLILIICNFIWLKIDTRPPHWDFAFHLSNVLPYYNFFQTKQIIPFLTYSNWLPPYSYNYYPPLSYYLTVFFYKLFGISEDIAVLSLTPFLIILIFSTFKIGQTLKNSKLGILMVISLVGMPFLMSQTREYLLDFPLTAMVALNLYVFLKTDSFNNRKFSLIFGCTSGLAMLTKWTYLAFFVGMLLIGYIFSDKKKYLIQFKNIAIVLLMIIIVSGPWYINALSKLKSSFNENISIAIEEHDPKILSKESFLWYPYSLYAEHLRFPLSTLAIIGFIYLIKNWKKYKKIRQLFFVSLFYLLVMTFYRNKDGRFIEPLMPFFTILIGFWILELKNLYNRFFLTIFLILLCIFNYYTSSFGIKIIPKVLISKLFATKIIWYKQYGYTFGPPKNENWYLNEIIDEIESSSKGGLIILNEDKMFLNMFNIIYRQMLYKNLKAYVAFDNNMCKYPKYFYNYDYIIFNDNQKGEMVLGCKVILEKYFKERTLLLPDDSKLTIFKKKIY